MKKEEALSLPGADEAAVKRISGALAELGSIFFPIPMPTSYGKEERARYAKAGADFAGHAVIVLAEMPERRARELTDHFLLAILAAVDGRFLAGDVIQRLQDEVKRLKLQRARKAREPGSAATDKILRRLAHECWMKNPKRCKSAEGTADEIRGRLNAALATKGLKPLGRDAIRKRVQRYRKHLEQTTGQTSN
jgi:hypothetical protein